MRGPCKTGLMRWYRTTKSASSDMGRRFHEAYERLAPAYGGPDELSYGYPWEDEHPEYHRLMSRIFSEIEGDTPAERARSWHTLFEKYGPSLPTEAELLLGKSWEEEPEKYRELMTKVFEDITRAR